MNIFAMTEIRRLAAILAPMSRDLRVPAPSSATAVSTRNGQRVHTKLIQLAPYVDAHLNSVFWRLRLLLFPTGIALALALFYVVLPTATCRPNDAGCFALAWALWIVGCYALAGVAVALRIIRNTLRHRLFARQDFSSDGAQFCDDPTPFVQPSHIGHSTRRAEAAKTVGAHSSGTPALRRPVK